MTPSNPTMAALFDIVRARSSASVAPPPVPVVTPSGYVSFTGVVRRASNVATNDPADVIGSSASSFDRLMKSVLQREDWAECARVSYSWDDISGCQRSEIVRLREVAATSQHTPFQQGNTIQHTNSKQPTDPTKICSHAPRRVSCMAPDTQPCATPQPPTDGATKNTSSTPRTTT